MNKKGRKVPQKLANLPGGSLVCADANVLAYHFTQVKPLALASTAFLLRGLSKQIHIVTTPQIVSDVVHRVMLHEAQRHLNLPANQLANYLKKHPQVVRKLTEHLKVPTLLRRLNVDIRPVTHIHLHAAKRFRRDYGLMANDSLLLGFMVTERIQHLASNDRDFRRIPQITLWVP